MPVRLNKAVCERCRKKKAPWMWTAKDEIRWQNGCVSCPAPLRVQYQDLSCGVPEVCLYPDHHSALYVEDERPCLSD